jgi:hypothetical protein
MFSQQLSLIVWYAISARRINPKIIWGEIIDAWKVTGHGKMY